MSVDFGSGNTTRWYSIPDSPDFTLPDSDWTWVVAGYNRSHTLAQYLVSNDVWGAANSFNLFTYQSSGLGVRVGTQTELAAFSGALTDGEFYLLYAARRSGTLVAGAIPFGANSFSEGSGVTLSGTTNSLNEINIGRRQDGFSDRYWHGNLEYVAFSNTKAITSDEALALANGLPLLDSDIGQSCHFVLPMHTASASINDIISGNTATQNGTSYGSFEDERFIVYPHTYNFTEAALSGGATVKGVRATLYSKAETLQANLTGIHVAWFDQSSVGSLSTPVFTTSTATTDANGLLEIDLDATTALSVGSTGFIVIYKPDGGNHKLSPVFASQMDVINIG